MAAKKGKLCEMARNHIFPFGVGGGGVLLICIYADNNDDDDGTMARVRGLKIIARFASKMSYIIDTCIFASGSTESGGTITTGKFTSAPLSMNKTGKRHTSFLFDRQGRQT